MLSFGGKRSSILFGKGDFEESHEEKESHKIHTKADPTKAVSEAQPGMAGKAPTPDLREVCD